MKMLRQYWPVLMTALVVLGGVAANIHPYDWNITSIFAMDQRMAEANSLPSGFIVLAVPSYDGAQYYQIARNMPLIFSPSKWHELKTSSPGSYAYQRFLLPFTAYILSLGHEAALPWTFLLINILSLIALATLVLRWKSEATLYAVALALCPSAMVAMHFMLAEPLTLLLLTAVLSRLKKNDRIEATDVLLLSLIVLAREVNILFIGFLIAFFGLRMKWSDVARLCIPAAVFVALHAVIYLIFGNVPFLISAGAHEFPGAAALQEVIGAHGYNRFSLSAIAILFGFVLPNLLWTGNELLRRKQRDLFTIGAFVFLCVMLVMPSYIWGSITSIGRVITPVYPLVILSLAERDTWTTRFLALLILLVGLGASAGLAMSVHPFSVTA